MADDELSHYGVKGMHWGVRKSRGSNPRPERVTAVQKRNGKIVTSGGRHRHASKDAIKVAKINQVARKNSTNALSNQQLQEAIRRMQLEQQYNQLAPKSRLSRGGNFAKKLLINTGSQQANRVANQEATIQVDRLMSTVRK